MSFSLKIVSLLITVYWESLNELERKEDDTNVPRITIKKTESHGSFVLSHASKISDHASLELIGDDSLKPVDASLQSCAMLFPSLKIIRNEFKFRCRLTERRSEKRQRSHFSQNCRHWGDRDLISGEMLPKYNNLVARHMRHRFS